MTSKTVFILVMAACLIAPAAAPAQSIRIEAENFTNYYDYMFNQIQSFALTGCSSGYAVYGLDAVNEWIEYEFSVGALGVYSFSLSYKADDQVDYHLLATLTGGTSGEVQSVDVYFTGLGYG